MKDVKTSNGIPQHYEKWAYGLFILVAIILLLVSWILFIFEKEPWAGMTLNVGASVLVVVIVEFLWRKITGGDPITRAIASLYSAITELGEMRSAGITSIKNKRRDLENSEYAALWCRLLENAKEVDLMAFTLSSQFGGKKDIMTALEDAISLNLCQVKVLTFHPYSDTTTPDSVASRRIDEENLIPEAGGARARFMGSLEQTRRQFEAVRDKFSTDLRRQECLKIAETQQITMYMSIIRIDERMWVSPYLSSVKGGDSPVFEITGTQTPLFNLFNKEFEHMWKHAKLV